MTSRDLQFQIISKQHDVEVGKQWRENWDKIPFFELPPGFSISVKPPITMADARFLVKHPDGTVVSVYLDLHDNLGYFGSPHWEVHPDKFGDNSRVSIEDTDTLVKLATHQ